MNQGRPTRSCGPTAAVGRLTLVRWRRCWTCFLSRGVQVRILGGSLEQSNKMYGYLRQMFSLPILGGLTAGQPTQRRVELINGSGVEVLSQSQRSVRGQHVHKMRCDEVDEFNPEIWEATQLVTRSGRCGSSSVRGSVEALSTMHRPFGLMNQLVERGQAGTSVQAKLFRWCALDVVQRCPPQRDCDTCVLWDDCQGRAKHAQGFVPVDDLVAQWHRCSQDAWGSEMMCRRPRRSDSVYPNFDPTPGRAQVLHTGIDRALDSKAMVVGGMDFGLRSPLVMLWGRVRSDRLQNQASAGPHANDTRAMTIEIFDEYIDYGLTLEQHLDRIDSRGWPKPQWVSVDPAGAARNAQTGLSDVQVLRNRGCRVRVFRSTVRSGIECVRRRLDHGTLVIHPACQQLIQALVLYHFDPKQPSRDEPVKDGPDHLCDALRYLVVGFESGGGQVAVRSYW